MQTKSICHFFFFLLVEMNVIQNVQVSTHFRDVSFSSTCHIFPEGNGQKLKLASLVFSKLACA